MNHVYVIMLDNLKTDVVEPVGKAAYTNITAARNDLAACADLIVLDFCASDSIPTVITQKHSIPWTVVEITELGSTHPLATLTLTSLDIKS